MGIIILSKRGLFHTIGACRQFFNERAYLETPTPPMVSNPGMEAHLHPYKVVSNVNRIQQEWFLHTSPEFHMKALLSEGFEKIYHLGYCFRDEPNSETHRPQFLMLEWYQKDAYYHAIKEETIELIKYVHGKLLENKIDVIPNFKVQEVTVDELFKKHCGFSILDHLEIQSLKNICEEKFPHYVQGLEDEELPWEDYFYLIFLNEIEPHFKSTDLLIVDEFPYPLAALSTQSKKDPRVCERFEIYFNGVELCNCFNELTDLKVQKERFVEESIKKEKLYGYKLPAPQILYEALEKGLPKSSGNALGVERLYLSLSVNKTINPFYD